MQNDWRIIPAKPIWFVCRRLILLCVWGLLLPAQAWAFNLNQQWAVVWDADAQMQAADVYAPSTQWRPDVRQGMYGYRSGALWAQFNVPAVVDGQKGWLLSVGYPYLDQIDIFVWGQTQPLVTMGDTVAAVQPGLSNTSHVVRLPALASEQRYVLRVQSTSAMNIKANLLSEEDLLHVQPESQFKAGVFVTLYLLSAIMYTLGAVVMRQPVQMAYSLYLLCLLAIFVGVSQPIALNEWLGSPRWANWVTGFGILVVPAASCMLWSVILQLPKNYPRLFKVYIGLGAYSVLSVLTVNTPYYQPAAQIAIFGILVLGVFNLGLAMWCMRQPAQRVSIGLYVLAFLLTTAAAIVNNLSVAGVIRYQPWFAAAFDASSLLHVLLLAIVTNMSIRKLEAANRESQFQQRLLATQRDQVQSFSAFVAHELLNPLARIGRSAEMLARETVLPARPAKRVADIRIWAFETGKLVEAFLSSATLKSGQALVKPVSVELTQWVRSVQTEFDLNYAHATIQWDLDDSASEATFDPLLAAVALENIVINALKYAGTDSPVVIHIAANHNVVTMTVDDEGPGLRPEQYAQIGSATLLRQPTQEQPGYGLGLSLVAHIAQVHGGSITASPRQPRGARWVLTLDSL
jgi:signal transduction histidine kinase